jgi:hypothetical protein
MVSSKTQIKRLNGFFNIMEVMLGSFLRFQLRVLLLVGEQGIWNRASQGVSL